LHFLNIAYPAGAVETLVGAVRRGRAGWPGSRFRGRRKRVIIRT
jgi:hypothetical protein